MKTHIKNGLCDMLFCCIAACALAYTIASGFDATYAVQDSLALFVVPIACLTVLLYVISYSPRTALGGSIVLVALAIAGLVVLASNTSEGSAFDDEAGRWGLFWVIVCLTTLGVFLLARKKTTALVLLVCGVLLSCVIQFLYWDFHTIPFALFILASVALVALKGYQAGLSRAFTKKPAFGAISLASLCLVGVALSLAAVAFFVIVEPLDPPRLNLILNTEYEKLEETEIKGVGDTYHKENPNILSSTSNGLLIASGNAEQNEEDVDENMDSTSQDDLAEDVYDAGSSLNLDTLGENDAALQITLNDILRTILVAVVAFLVLIVVVIVSKKISRRVWFNRVSHQNPKDQVKTLYAFIIKHLEAFGIKKNAGLTFAEFARNAESATVIFSNNESSATIKTATNLYSRVAYGDMSVEDKEVEPLRNYCKSFYKNARKYAGTFRYARKFFFI